MEKNLAGGIGRRMSHASATAAGTASKERPMKIRVAFALAVVICLATTMVAQQSKKPMRAAGRVSAVTQDSITIQIAPDKMTVAVDSATKVVGKGLGTKSQTMKTKGAPTAVTDLVKPSDHVIVTYVDAGEGKLRATEIHVRAVTKQ
jgi:hypothetical protein